MDTTNKKIIPIEVRDEYILGSGVSIGAMGSFGTMVLEATFDESWVGLTKYATWTDALGNVGEQILFTELDRAGDTSTYTYYIPITAFPLRHAGTVKLSFTGYVVEGDKIRSVMNTATGTFRVLESNAVRIDDDGVDASIGDQLHNTESKLSESASKLKEQIDYFEIAERERDEAENGYTDINGNFVPGRVQNEDKRVDAERQRQINEFGAEGNRYDSYLGYVVNADGVKVENDQAGRVGAEIQRQIDENKRISNETSREERFSEMEKLVGDLPEALEAILALQESLIGGDEQ
jgi:hypothetical protein